MSSFIIYSLYPTSFAQHDASNICPVVDFTA